MLLIQPETEGAIDALCSYSSYLQNTQSIKEMHKLAMICSSVITEFEIMLEVKQGIERNMFVKVI